MLINSELARTAAKIVADNRLAMLATADDKGMAHASWMTAQVTPDLEEVISVTAPITRKVADLRCNPQAEWMFASNGMETLVYLSGRTRVVEGEAAKRYWDRMTGKDRAYYRKYCDTDDYTNFVIVRTAVQKIVVCKPYAYKKTVLLDKHASGGAEGMQVPA
jgi:general stress protein 26